jgi:hypothetical protein
MSGWCACASFPTFPTYYHCAVEVAVSTTLVCDAKRLLMRLIEGGICGTLDFEKWWGLKWHVIRPSNPALTGMTLAL